jgi:hypothetical protein
MDKKIIKLCKKHFENYSGEDKPALAGKDRCRICARIYRKKYFAENKEDILAKGKLFYQENKSEFAKNSKAYRERNREKVLEAKKSWAQKNPDRIKAAYKKWYEKNKAKKQAKTND